MKWFCIGLLLIAACSSSAARSYGGEPWKRHAIDQSFRGADGVRLADFDRDGLLDVVTGWEESGLVRLYLNPGHENAKSEWPAVTVGKAKSPEDAVPLDVDADGSLDVVSCHEGKQRELLVHWNQAHRDSSSTSTLLSESNWASSRFPQLDGQLMMFATPLAPIDSRTAFVVGSKGSKASLTLMVGPKVPTRDLSSWKAYRLRDAGWIMSIRALDMDEDGDQDIVFSDRKGSGRRAAWLEQPDELGDEWKEHPIAGDDEEVMFMTATSDRCLIATREGVYLDCKRSGNGWEIETVSNPTGVPFGKAIELLPDGKPVLTCNSAAGPNPDSPGVWTRDESGQWSAIDPTTRVKFDRIELIDLDGDGDLDVMTCEERRNLGVVWYENPQINR